ncbi:MAG: hypothetical protein NVSMB4_21650 [Acidimicrobiales bacterium]
MCLLWAEADLGDGSDQMLLHQAENAEEQIGNLGLEGPVRVVTAHLRRIGRRGLVSDGYGVGRGHCEERVLYVLTS